MKANEIFEKGQILTVAVAKELKGKKIACTSAEYHMNTPHISQFVVGKIVSAWDDSANREYPEAKFKNIQEYWASYMTEKQVDEMKTKLQLFSEDGTGYFVAHTKYSNFYPEPTFTGSDADREVYYVEV